ncbi:MAG: hypothetical protein A2Y23_11840 [Clostridiales bacterium GWB2_37_7]|nr:MAG: hypothetical protein A2Y23_11840 [Clostridiales bacterium GWB2_37_7]
MNIPMIDTLCVTVDIRNYGYKDIDNKLAIDILSYLGPQKEEARIKTSENVNYKHLIEIGGQSFQLLQNGSLGYAYILHNDAYEIRIAQVRSKSEKNYPVYIKIKQDYLWAKGIQESWQIVKEWIIKHVGEIKATKVNRIDLCCHTDEMQLNESDIDTFEGRYQTDIIYRFKRQISDMVFGSRTTGKVMCRIYDKTLEVNQKKQKLWFFDVWKKKGLNANMVWNIEFEISREFLKEVKLDEIEEVLANLKTLWTYCTQSWLLKKNLDATRLTRCSTDVRWQVIQKAFDSFEGAKLVTREQQLDSSAMALIPGTIGHITSFAAKADITDINRVFEIIKSHGVRYLHSKESNYAQVIENKMALIAD